MIPMSIGCVCGRLMLYLDLGPIRHVCPRCGRIRLKSMPVVKGKVKNPRYKTKRKVKT